MSTLVTASPALSDVSYVLPIRGPVEVDTQLTAYVAWLSERVDVVIADGSPERGMCSWLAVLTRLRGGVVYGGVRLSTAAHSTMQLASGSCCDRDCGCRTPLVLAPRRRTRDGA